MHQQQGGFEVVRTIVVQDQLSEKVSVHKLQLQLTDNILPLWDAFRHINLDISDRVVRVYDFQRNAYCPVQTDTPIPLSWISGNSCDLVLVKLGSIIHSITSSNSKSGEASNDPEKESEESDIKKERSKERVIFQVIEIVKKWRELHLSKNSIKKMSLLEAAKSVGLPKKSLDDYYYQLRLAEKYGFEFEIHLFDRMGVLRTYLKNLKANARIDKAEKHPRNLKIIDKFDQISEVFYGSKNLHYYPQSHEHLQKMEEQVIEQMPNESSEKEEQGWNKASDYKSEFQYLLDEKDPFIVGDYNFKKNLMEADESQIFF